MLNARELTPAGSCRRVSPPVLGAKCTDHGKGACAAGGNAPPGATRWQKLRQLTCAGALVILSSVALADTPPPIVAAVKANNVAAVQSLIKQRAGVNAAEADGTTALQWAARADNLDMARALLKAGADPKKANRYGITALHLAAVNGSTPMVRLLIEAGADVTAVLPEGETILMTAARTGRAEALDALLNAGATLDAREKLYGETALHWAAAENHAEAVRLLLTRGADVDERSNTQTYRRRSGQSVMPLGSWTPLMYAARQNAVDAGRVLASRGARLDLADPDGATALVVAIINANYDFAAMLLDAGADPKAALANGNNALMFAAGLGWRDGSPAAPSYDQGSPEDAVATIELLLTKGLDINDTNTTGDTPLHAAVSGRAAPEIVRALIQHGAKVDVPNKRGQTPLALASPARGTKDLSAITEILKAAGSRPAP